jgi:uncharacterized integral membrane protein
MSKIKVVLLIILAAVVVDFAVENAQPAVVIKLFKFQLGELPQFLVVYLSLAVGLVIGWVAHGFRIRRIRREAQAAPAASAQQQQQESH